MRSRSRLRLGAIAWAALLTIGCSAGGTTAGSAAPSASVASFNDQSTLTLRTDGPWATFDPSKGGNLPSIQVTAGLYDRLIDMAPDGRLVPYLATSWEQTASSVKFTLRKDVTCSDGTPLTATMVARSFDDRLGISDPKTKSPSVIGEFGSGPFTVAGDDAAGTFTLNLGSPFSEAMTGFALGGDGLVICPAGLGAGKLDDVAAGTGPYKVASQDRTTSITLALRPEWKWGPNGRTATGLPGKIVYRIVTNETTAANLLLTGDVDVARIQGTDVKRLLTESSLGKLVKTPLYTNPMWINANAGHPTADPAVRQALSMAVSADGWNQAAFGGLGIVTTSVFANNAPCFEPQTAQYVPQTDIAKAKQVLVGAGYAADSSGKLSKGGQPLKILVVGETPQGAGPEYLQTQFTQLGVTVDFVVTDHVNYSAAYLQPGKFDVIVPGIASDVLGQYVLSYIGADPPAGRNFSHTHDAAIEKQVTSALQQTGAQACQTWKDIQVAWLKGYYFRPLSAQNFYWFSRNPKWSFNANTSVLQPNSLN